MLHRRFSWRKFRWLRACASGTFGLLLAGSSANAQQAVPATVAPPPLAVSNPAAALPEESASAAVPPVTAPVPFIFGSPDASAAAPETDLAPWWRNVPPVQRLPPAAYFPIRPNGPGYYSLRDVLEGNYREGPPKWPILPFCITFNSFFDLDYRYLDDPNNRYNTEADPLNFLHRIHIGNDWMFDTGGELRARYNDESNSRLSGINDDFGLFRLRAYGDLWYRDNIRLFAEFITADATPQTLKPLITDRNSADFQNLFLDLKVWSFDDKPVYLRAGRQELLYGSERQVAPLDWFNTRRTFEGAKGFWQNDQFSLDIFGVVPVVPNPGGWSSTDDKSFFSGVWGTYRPEKGIYFDLYCLNLNRETGAATGMGPYAGAYNETTVGSRYAGQLDRKWLWDMEGTLQFGTYQDRRDFAHAITTGVGYAFSDLPMIPQVWVVYDHASGTGNPRSGTYSTFNQDFHFGHPVFGWIDDFGRDNMNDISVQLECFPTKWITAWTQFHVLRLDDAKDGLYNPGGLVLRQDPTGKAGTDVGEEINFVLNFHLSNHIDFLAAYVHLFAGDFIKETGKGLDANTVWLQASYRW